MKTKYIKISVSIIISLLMILAVHSIFGQGRSGSERRDYSRVSRSESKQRNSDRIVKANRKSNRSSDHRFQNSRKNNSYEINKRYRNDRRDTKTYRHPERKQKYTPAHSKSKHNYGMPYGHMKKKVHYVNHKHYTYHTWHYPAPWRYARQAVVFRHEYGNYYYHHGHFYRYHHNRGYFRVRIPTDLVFTRLPAGYQEVYVNGRLYFSYGNVFFEYTRYGYRIIPPDSGIYISAHF